jgi:hypothetical protein
VNRPTAGLSGVLTGVDLLAISVDADGIVAETGIPDATPLAPRDGVPLAAPDVAAPLPVARAGDIEMLPVGAVDVESAAAAKAAIDDEMPVCFVSDDMSTNNDAL